MLLKWHRRYRIGQSLGERGMRVWVLALGSLWLVVAPAASAGPTCMDRNGAAARCGSPGAMPFGWSLPAEEVRRRDLANPPSAQIGPLLKAVCVVALFLCAVALLPEFDGSRSEDWEDK
jgi:hypothetical protein